MARIRSIHPGIWTDERFVSLSFCARLFFMGLMNECDDAGTFEWSPLKLKMRLMPADNVDAAGVLSEILIADCIRKYEIDGRELGVIRNFCRWQRPKSPNILYDQPSEIRVYAGNVSAEGGGRREEEGDISVSKETSPLLPKHVMDAWNEMAARKGLATVRSLSEGRKTKLKARIREHPLEHWMDALNAIERSSFLLGENDRGWRADFDFLLQPSSFQKLIEGSYDRK